MQAVLAAAPLDQLHAYPISAAAEDDEDEIRRHVAMAKDLRQRWADALLNLGRAEEKFQYSP